LPAVRHVEAAYWDGVAMLLHGQVLTLTRMYAPQSRLGFWSYSILLRHHKSFLLDI
jgi:hypothetical protein